MDEGQHLQTVFPPARSFGGPGRFCFHENAHLTEDSPLLTADNSKKLMSEWSIHWDLGKHVLIEKSPPNIIRSRFLQAFFPDSLFVFVIRHPIAVTMATWKIVRKKPAPERVELSELMRHWFTAHRIMCADLPHIKRKLLFRYEDFVNHPHKVLSGIYRHVSLPVAQVSSLHDSRIMADLNQAYFQDWKNGRMDEAKQPSRRELDLRYDPEVREYGYSMIEPDKLLPFSTENFLS